MASDLLTNLKLPSVPVIGGGLVLLVAFDIAFRYWKALRSIKYLPGRRELFGIGSVARQFLPTIPGIVISRHEAIDIGHSIYVKYGRDIISLVEMIPSLRRHIFVADPLAVKEISAGRFLFPKNVKVYASLRYFGSNLIATNDEEWRRQRKIVAPSFSEKNNKLVWNEVVRLGLEIFDVWGRNSAVAYVNDSVYELTLPLALAIISSAGFGQPTSWSASTQSEIPRGHTMTFTHALHVTSINVIKLANLPKWVVKLSKSLREGEKAANELGMYLREMIEEHKNGVGLTERNDIFGAMLAANMNSPKDSPDEQLSEQELLGNMFVLIVAGHETSAHTLSFALGLLAIEQEEQEKLYQHILSVSPGQEIPAFESFSQLSYAQAVVNETMRLYPPVTEIPKFASEDTFLSTVGPDGEVEQIFVPAKAEIRLDTVGLHYNPRYWPDPYTFNPSRFLGEYNHDAFIPFSTGARACIGKRFSETEIVAFLALLLKFYRVELKDKASYQGLSKLEQRKKLFPTLQVLTTTPKNPVSLAFVKREVKT